MMNRIVEVQNLTKYYGKSKAVDDVSFTIEEGTIFGLLGTNGAGKSTTIKILTGQLLPSSGAVSVCGLNPAKDEKALARKIGVVPDQVSLYKDMTVANNLTFFARLYGVNQERVERIIDELKLEAYSKKKIKQLSKGYKQRVLIARALLHDPEVLFLDEPTASLDPEISAELHSLFLGLRDSGKTIILTTHDLGEAEALCEEVIVIDQGKVVLSKKVSEIRDTLSSSCLIIETADGRRRISYRDIEELLGLPEQSIKSLSVKRGTLHDAFLESVEKA